MYFLRYNQHKKKKKVGLSQAPTDFTGGIFGYEIKNTRPVVRVIIWWHNKELAAASVVYLSRTSQSAQVALEVGIWKTADNDKQLITGRKCNERGKSRRQSVGGSKRQIACMVHNERARLCVCELTPTDVRPDMIPV